MKNIACSVIVLILLFLVAGQARSDDRADTARVGTIVSGVVAAYGGAKTLENLSSIYMRGHIDAFAFDDQGTYTMYFERPGKLLVDIRYSRSEEIRIRNGSKGYYGTESSPPYEVRGFRYLAILYQYKSQDIPYGLLKSEYKLEYEGTGEVAGFPVEVLGLKDREGPPMRIYVDMKTFLIRKISGIFSIGGASTILSSEFSDFRKIGGTVMPYRITNFAAGQKIAETVIREYRVNEPMKASLFNPATYSNR